MMFGEQPLGLGDSRAVLHSGCCWMNPFKRTVFSTHSPHVPQPLSSIFEGFAVGLKADDDWRWTSGCWVGDVVWPAGREFIPSLFCVFSGWADQLRCRWIFLMFALGKFYPILEAAVMYLNIRTCNESVP